MSKPHGIIVFGASGSGTTTIARELARVLNLAHFDADDYFWQKTTPPYSIKRESGLRIAMLESDILKYGSFVISGSMRDWGAPFEAMFDLGIYVETPTVIRLERLKKRELERFGKRILPGGDMYNIHRAFIEWAEEYDGGGMDMRSRAMHEQWIKELPCPLIRIDGTENYELTAADIANRFYTKPGEPWRVSVAALGKLEKYRFTVIIARYKGSWLYSRHKERKTYETAGGHIEWGETPLEAARRELYEETGAVKFEITPVFDYAVHRDAEFSYGQVFYADIETLGEIPPDSEMSETLVFQSIPEKMTYPTILPVLYDKMQAWLNLQSAKDEIWDVYDAERKLTGRKHRRADPLPSGDYHLVVHVWLQNGKGEFLITKRAPNKGYPNMWECTGGSAVAGDDSIAAAIREVKEETGLDVKSENGKSIFTITRNDSICDVWLFRQDFDIQDVILQENETTDAKYATADEIRQMIDDGEFIAFHYIQELFEKARNQSC